MRAPRAEKKAPEPKVFSAQQTSTFYVDTEGKELSANDMFEAGSDYRSSNSQNELFQYRPELLVDWVMPYGNVTIGYTPPDSLFVCAGVYVCNICMCTNEHIAMLLC